MKGIALALAIIIGNASGSTTLRVPFDRYIASVKKHRHSQVLIQFAKECGLSLLEKQPVYGLQVGEWKPSHNLPKDVYDSESDFFNYG